MTASRLDDTNTHTFFLREAEALEAVVRHVGAVGSVWSAGCSTGEEVYSLAMLARESGTGLTITGTDINEEALDTARRGRYPERRVRKVDALRRATTFDRNEDGTFVVKNGLRNLIRFARHNLATDAPPTNGTGEVRSWDAILCRNVFLYLNADEIEFALASFAKALKPNGLLLFGASELMSSVLHSHRPRLHGLVLSDLGGVWGYRRRDPASQVLSFSDPVAPPTAGIVHSASEQLVADVVSAMREQGDRFLDGGDPRSALDIFVRAAERDGLHADIHLRIAVCQLQTGSPHHAREALRRALFLEPTLWPAAMLLGDLMESSEPQAARQYFQQALEALLSNEQPSGIELQGALAPFVAGRPAAVEALECRVRLIDERQQGTRP